MSKTNSRYIIVALLPADVSAQIEFVQKKFQNKFWKIIMPPHVTLTRPGTAQLDDASAIQKLGQLDLPKGWLSIKADHIEWFLNGDDANVVYLAVEPDPSLTIMHNALLQKVPTFMEQNQEFDNFVPHITLANNLSDQGAVDDTVAIISGKNLSVDYNCDRIHLFKKADADPKWIWLAERILG